MGIDLNNLINNYEEKFVKKEPEVINNHPKFKAIKQNEVWLVELGEDNIVGHEQKGNRPFYVISSSKYNDVSQTPVGFFTSTSEKKKTSKYVVEVDVGGGHKQYVNISQIRTLCTSRFKKLMYVGRKEDLKDILDRYDAEIING